MNLNKVLLTAALLVSGHALVASEGTPAATATAAAVSSTASLVSRAKAVLLNFYSKGSEKAKTLIEKLPCPGHIPAPMVNFGSWTYNKGAIAGKWVQNHTPAVVKNIVSNRRNWKIAGIGAAAVATAIACWHYFGDKLMAKTSTTPAAN